MTQSPGQYRRLLLRSFGLELVMLGVCGAIVGYALARWCVTPTFQTTILFRIFGEQPPPTGEFAPPPSEDRHRPHSYRQLATRIRTGNLLLPDLPTLFRRLEFDDGLRERLRTAGGAASDAAYELSGHWGVPEGNAAGQAEHFAEIAVRTVNPEHGKIVADAAARLFLQEVSAVPGLRRVHCSPNAVGPVRWPDSCPCWRPAC